MVLHHSCLILPGCHSGSADDTDAALNRRLRAVVEGSGMWKEMQVISNRIKPGPPPALHQNVNIWASFYPWKDQLRPFSEKQIYHQSTCPASFIYYSILTSMYNRKEILLGSVWLRFSFKSYWHHVQWPHNLWELLGPLTEVVKHLDWLGRCEMCAVMAYCRLYVCATCRESCMACSVTDKLLRTVKLSCCKSPCGPESSPEWRPLRLFDFKSYLC